MQLYTPADIYADLQTWCYTPDDLKPDLPDRAWYVLQGQVFGHGLDSILPYLRLGNDRCAGVRMVIYDAATKQVCAVGLCEAVTPTDWSLSYYFASAGSRKCRVFEAALPTLTAWLVAEATRQAIDTRLTGQLRCAEDGCRLAFTYRATPQGRLLVEQDEMTCG